MSTLCQVKQDAAVNLQQHSIPCPFRVVRIANAPAPCCVLTLRSAAGSMSWEAGPATAAWLSRHSVSSCKGAADATRHATKGFGSERTPHLMHTGEASRE